MRPYQWTILLALTLSVPGCFTLNRITPAINLDMHVVEHKKNTCHLCDLYHQKRTGLVRILVPGGQGVGIVVSETGDILTHAHGIAAAERIQVETHDLVRHPATVAHQDPGLDLALLRVNAPEGTVWTAVPLDCTRLPRIGDHVYAIGYPLGLGWTVTPGMVSAHCKAGEAGPVTMLQTDAILSPGNTGGPLLDRLGRLTGVITSSAVAPGSKDAACAIPVEELNAFLARKPAKP